MKITTWNVNSIRTRLDHVGQWLTDNPVDVLCLQETKVIDADFPRGALEALGYHPYCWGQKSYNGVALISRQPLSQVDYGFVGILEADPALKPDVRTQAEEFDQQKRVISAIVAPGLRVVNLYVPNGSEIGSDKYTYKLAWFGVLRKYLATLLLQPEELVICGDFNIALEDRDIHDPKGRENHIMASDVERDALRSILDLGFADGFRKVNQDASQFSWWDYRSGSFPRNKGWRIDHHYLTSKAYERVVDCTIDKSPRQLPQPSDHTPVVLDIAW
jgi:exodeoxyribonuclease III